jgi:hypothetical protein
MPVRRRSPKARAAGLSDVAWAFLTDQPPSDPGSDATKWEAFVLEHEADYGRGLRTLWTTNETEVLEAWMADHPGTRPTSWWRWTAPRIPLGLRPGTYDDGTYPLPREIVGGTGTPGYMALPGLQPRFHLGVAIEWIWPCDAERHAGSVLRGGEVFSGIAVDEADPPRVESQAMYLRRLRLLLPGELRCVGAQDFAPEVVDFDAWGRWWAQVTCRAA